MPTRGAVIVDCAGLFKPRPAAFLVAPGRRLAAGPRPDTLMSN